MAIDFNKVASAGISAVQKVAKEAGTTLPIKLDIPNDSFGGKILDADGIEAVMKKFDLLIAQANERLSEITRKYNQEKALSKRSRGTEQTWKEHKKATKALRELSERKAKFQQKPELVQEFLDEQQKAPNTSFLFDPLLSQDEKKAILATHDEIIKLQNIYSTHPTIESMITSGKFFDSKQVGREFYVDLSDPINAQNYQKLSCALPLSFTKVAKEIGMSQKEIARYCANGFFDQIKLINRKTGEEVYTRAIDWQSDVTKAGLERLKQLHALAPKASKQVTQMRAQGKRLQVPTFYLSKLGYGSEEEINKMLLAKKIPFTTQEVIGKNNQPRKVVIADLSSDKASAYLNFMLSENKDLCSIEEMAKIAKVSKTEIEDALLSGELIPQKESLFRDGREVVINKKAKANQAFIDKKAFEKQLSREKQHKESSLRSELAWHFCPKTKKAASQGYALNLDEIKKTQAEILSIQEKIANPNLTPEEIADLENELLRLKSVEDVLNRKTHAFMWKVAGEEEYNQGMARAKELIAQVKTQGIDSIKDEEIRAIFQAHQG